MIFYGSSFFWWFPMGQMLPKKCYAHTADTHTPTHAPKTVAQMLSQKVQKDPWAQFQIPDDKSQLLLAKKNNPFPPAFDRTHSKNAPGRSCKGRSKSINSGPWLLSSWKRLVSTMRNVDFTNRNWNLAYLKHKNCNSTTKTLGFHGI